MSEFEIRFSMFGSAFIEAETVEEAQKIVSGELIRWSGFGTDIDQVEVDGVDTEVDR